MGGRAPRIDSRPGEVMKPDDVRVIQGEGMPFHGNPFTKGRLFVHFRVVFPTTMPPGAITALKAVLPKAKELTLTGEEEECNMTPADVSQFGQQGESRRMETTDEDDEEGRGSGQRVQCQNM